MNNNYSTGSFFSLFLLNCLTSCCLQCRKHAPLHTDSMETSRLGNNRCGLLVFGGELLTVSEQKFRVCTVGGTVPALNSLRGNRGINGDHGAGDASLRTLRLTRASDCSTRELCPSEAHSQAPQQQVMMCSTYVKTILQISIKNIYNIYFISITNNSNKDMNYRKYNLKIK